VLLLLLLVQDHSLILSAFFETKSYPVRSGKGQEVAAEEAVTKDESEVGNTIAGGDAQDDFEEVFESDIDPTAFYDTQMDGTAGSEHRAGPLGEGPAADYVPSRAENHAARVIQHAYRRFVLRGRGVGLSGLSAELDPLFSLCLVEAQHIRLQPGEVYRKVYLGALPHILLCLEEVHKIMLAAKADVKERFKVADPLELEELGNRQTELV
jgi:hypothetical protein